ncbi:MAG TPA: hypothetical protein VND21_12110 [Planctomycetota bacterium]|nr:hypothetical protein [Planctomycetota bacterium]
MAICLRQVPAGVLAAALVVAAGWTLPGGPAVPPNGASEAPGAVSNEESSVDRAGLLAAYPRDLATRFEVPDRPAAARVAGPPEGTEGPAIREGSVASEPLVSIPVRVVVFDPDDEPAIGVRVRVAASRAGPAPQLAEGRTDDEGRLTLGPVAVPSEGVWVVAESEGRRDEVRAALDDSWSEWIAVTLRLRPMVEVAGRVLDPQGRPQAGLQVRSGGSLEEDAVRAGTDGGFRLGAARVHPPDDMHPAPHVRLVAGEWPYRNGKADVAVPDGSARIEADIVLDAHDPVRRVSGTVRLPDGSPAVGARVSYDESGPLRRRRVGVDAPEHDPAVGLARCDAEGGFAMDVPEPFLGCTLTLGLGSVTASLPGYVSAGAPVPRDTEAPAVIHLSLARGITIEGRVVDADGLPVAHAVVGVARGDQALGPAAVSGESTEEVQEPAWGPVLVLGCTDEHGRFVLPDAPAPDAAEEGPLFVRALWVEPAQVGGADRVARAAPWIWTEARDAARTWAPVPLDGSPIAVRLPLAAARVPVRFRLRGDGARPAVAGLVSIAWLAAGDGPEKRRWAPARAGEVVVDLPPGSRTYTLAGEDLGETRVDLDLPFTTDETVVDVPLAGGASVGVQVRLPPDLAPQDVTLRLVTDRDIDERVLRRGTDGAFRAIGIAPGPWRIAPRVFRDEAWVTAGPCLLDLEEGASQDVAVRLVRGTEVTVDVVCTASSGASSRPPAVTCVEVRDPAGLLRDRVEVDVEGLEDDDCASIGILLPHGAWRLALVRDGAALAAADTHVVPDAETTVTLAFRE